MGRKLRKVLGLIYFFIYDRAVQVFTPLRDQAVFLTEAHGRLNGNLKAVCDAVCTERRCIVHVKADRRESLQFREFVSVCRDMASSKYILLDDYYGLTSAIKVRKGQKLIQLWHGAGAYKKFGYSRVSSGNIGRVHSGYRKYTGAAVTADSIRWCFAEAFGIDEDKVAAVGNPKTDIFFDAERTAEAKERVHSAYPQLGGKKVVLFAPTYMGNRVEDAYYDFDAMHPSEIAKDLGDKYAIALRWHPALSENIKKGIVLPPEEPGLTDVSDYPEMNELMAAADILVTDYSSVIFDWYLTGRPVVYFLSDHGRYEDERGTYFPLDTYVYGAVAEDYRSLIRAIGSGDVQEQKRRAFGDRFMSACDGNSTRKTVDWIFGR